MPVLPDLAVVRSPVHGYGVVARRRFACGEVILHGEGIVRLEDEVYDDTYSLQLPATDLPGAPGEHIYYDLVDQSRWINHSCEPNTSVGSAFDPGIGAPVVWWIALRDIEAGEELSYDYAFDGELAERCTCGAPACRGLIVDTTPEALASVPGPLRALLRGELTATIPAPGDPARASDGSDGDESDAINAINAIIAAAQDDAKIRWSRIPGKGFGVFARRDLAAGSLVELAPITRFPGEIVTATRRDDPSRQHVFTWGPGELAHLWGLGSLYNHSRRPNVEIDDGPVPGTAAILALRDIQAGEELCFDYGELWFDPL